MKWCDTEPTEKQLAAIDTYNHAYGVNILINSKQDAYDVISTYVPKQYLEFENGKVKGTNVYFFVVDSNIFNDTSYNDMIKERVKKVIVSEDGKTVTLYYKVEGGNQSDKLLQLAELMDKMMEYPSYSEEEDKLGYLSPDELKAEKDMYGVDPMWWK